MRFPHKGHASWVSHPITGYEWQVDDPPADNDPTAGTAETAPPAEEAQPPAPEDAQTDAVFPTVNGVRILVTNRVSAAKKEVLLPIGTTYPDMFEAVRSAFDKPIPVTIKLWYPFNEEPVNFGPRRILTKNWHDRKLLVYFYR